MRTALYIIFILLTSCASQENTRWMNDHFWQHSSESASYVDKYLNRNYSNQGQMTNTKYMGKEEIVQKVLLSHISELQSCFTSEIKQPARSTVQLVFTIRPDGKIQRVGIGESELDINTKACLVESLYAIDFPKNLSERNIKVNQPLVF